MKNLHLLFLFLLLSRISFSQEMEYSTSSPAQNLVPNPSFEDTVACPGGGFGNITKAKGWSAYSGDYFHVCVNSFNQDSKLGVPHNPYGFQYPVNNNCNAYAGIYSLISNFPIQPPNNYYREYLGNQLLSPLITGEKYFVSLKISLSDTANCATNNIGVLFTTVNYIYDSINYWPSHNYLPINFTHINSFSIIKDKTNWVTISGSFIADSAYRFIFIGNMYSDSKTNINRIVYNQDSCWAYYYIDDICVSTDSVFCSDYKYVCSTGINETPKKSIVNIYPNPTNSTIFLSLENKEKTIIELYNMLGEKIKKEEFFAKEYSIALTDYPNGLYFLKLQTKDYSITQKITVNQ